MAMWTNIVIVITCLQFYILSNLLLSTSCSSLPPYHLNDHKIPAKKNGSTTKLFVFGDSFVDTGNFRNKESIPWVYPYGITFPGKPSGRASNGLILTDYIASFLNISSPLPYMQWKNSWKPQSGMNFAEGGGGVFETWQKDSFTVQINNFQQLVKKNVYSKEDLENSVALVTYSGNDNAYFISTQNGTLEELPALSENVTRQLLVGVKRIENLGVKRIAITGPRPMQCDPQIIRAPFKTCSDAWRKHIRYQNRLRQRAVRKLNNQNGNAGICIYLDIYRVFLSIIAHRRKDNAKYPNPLVPCFTNVNAVCDDPDAAFYFDGAHPTQSAWNDVYQVLKTSLQQLV